MQGVAREESEDSYEGNADKAGGEKEGEGAEDEMLALLTFGDGISLSTWPESTTVKHINTKFHKICVEMYIFVINMSKINSQIASCVSSVSISSFTQSLTLHGNSSI